MSEPKQHPRFVGSRKPARQTLVGLDPEAVSGLAQNAAIEARSAHEALEDVDEDLVNLARETRGRLAEIAHVLGTMRGHLADQGTRLAEIEGAYLREVAPSFGAIKTALERVVEMQKAIVSLDERIGQPPTKLDLTRVSQVGTMTHAQIAELEEKAAAGSGLHAIVWQLVANDGRQAIAAADRAAREAAEKVAADAKVAAERALVVAKKSQRKSTTIVGSLATVAAGIAGSFEHWGPPLERLLKHLFGG